MLSYACTHDAAIIGDGFHLYIDHHLELLGFTEKIDLMIVFNLGSLAFFDLDELMHRYDFGWKNVVVHAKNSDAQAEALQSNDEFNYAFEYFNVDTTILKSVKPLHMLPFHLRYAIPVTNTSTVTHIQKPSVFVRTTSAYALYEPSLELVINSPILNGVTDHYDDKHLTEYFRLADCVRGKYSLVDNMTLHYSAGSVKDFWTVFIGTQAVVFCAMLLILIAIIRRLLRKSSDENVFKYE